MIVAASRASVSRRVLVWVLCDVADELTPGIRLPEVIHLLSVVRGWCASSEPESAVELARIQAQRSAASNNLIFGLAALSDAALNEHGSEANMASAVYYLERLAFVGPGPRVIADACRPIRRALPITPTKATYRLIHSRIVHQRNLQRQPPEVQVAWDVLEGAQ